MDLERLSNFWGLTFPNRTMTHRTHRPDKEDKRPLWRFWKYHVLEMREHFRQNPAMTLRLSNVSPC